MATLLSSIITDARVELKEATAKFWTDAELLSHLKKGIADLWGAVVDLHGDHYQTIDTTNVTMDANAETLTGVPADCFRILLIEPKDTTSSGSMRDVYFTPRKYTSADFRNARSQTALDPTAGVQVFYELTQAGAPVAAPTVLVAPKLSSQLALRFVYVPSPGVASLQTTSANPIPGESDNALMAWCIAYARAKEREDRMPDPSWVQIYATEKRNLLVRMTPRQEQEPEVIEDFYLGYLE